MNVSLKIVRFLFIIISISCVFLESAWALNVGDRVPSCLLKNMNNTTDGVNLEQLKGKPLYIDFWASWCGPCVKSFPYMDKVERIYKNKGFQVLAINLDENIEDAYEFLKKIPVGFSILQDKGQQCAKKFDVKAMPSSYLIDRQGIVQYIHLGFRSGEVNELEAQLEKIVNTDFDNSIGF